jgi:Mg-chelatase subunit ChlD
MAEVALVLDYSGSMNGKGKYQAMRDAAIGMIDTLTEEGKKTDHVKFGLVPFSHHVYLSLPGEYVINETPGTTWTNCTQDRKYPYNVQDTAPDPANADTLWGMEAGGGGGAYEPCGPYVTNNLVVAPLTNDATAVKTQLANMTPHNLTHIALGTEFGWALLSPDAPFTEGADYEDENTEKYLVMLTDGVQTEKAWGAGKTHTVPNGETNLEEMCTNIKAEGITIITIAFDLNDTWTEDRLKNCASSPDDFHIADNNDQLAQVFENIAGKLRKMVRISK